MTEVPLEGRRPASVRRRIVAHVVDSAIVAVVALAGVSVVSALAPPLSLVSEGDGSFRLVLDPLRLLGQASVASAISLAYFAWGWSRASAATPAQRALDIQVLDTDGHRLSVSAAATRWAVMGAPLGIVTAAVVETVVAWLAVVIVAVVWTGVMLASTLRHQQRRGLHDRLAGTLVLDVGDG